MSINNKSKHNNSKDINGLEGFYVSKESIRDILLKEGFMPDDIRTERDEDEDAEYYNRMSPDGSGVLMTVGLTKRRAIFQTAYMLTSIQYDHIAFIERGTGDLFYDSGQIAFSVMREDVEGANRNCDTDEDEEDDEPRVTEYIHL